MTAPAHETPSIPLSIGERDAFDRLMFEASHRPVVTRYYTPRARLRRALRRIARSPMAGDLRAAYYAAFWPSAIGAGVLLAAVIATATRGTYLDWSGFHPIPAGGTQ